MPIGTSGSRNINFWDQEVKSQGHIKQKTDLEA